MKKGKIAQVLMTVAMLLCSFGIAQAKTQAVVIDHTDIDITKIPAEYVKKAQQTLKVAFGSSGHGLQLIAGMDGLYTAKGEKWAWSLDGSKGIEVRKNPFAKARYCGDSGRDQWVADSKTYLDAHPEINVVVWTWCGGVSQASEQDISAYLKHMEQLETAYPNVKFVYMTGHLDGTGSKGNLHQRNEQIRKFCLENGKFLYDFADIESYDPDGNYYLDKLANDMCNYDANGDGKVSRKKPLKGDKNWALDWQASHKVGVDYYAIDKKYRRAHTHTLNKNLKGNTAWAMWARLAGWDGK